MMRDEVEAFIRHMFERTWAGHADEVVSEDYVDHNMAPGLPPTREGFKQLREITLMAFPDFEVVVEDVLVDGDKAAVRLTNRGTHTGPFMGKRPTGNQLEWATWAIFRVEGNKVVERWGLVDMLTLLRGVGML